MDNLSLYSMFLKKKKKKILNIISQQLFNNTLSMPVTLQDCV